jgi:hypothetical protein
MNEKSAIDSFAVSLGSSAKPTSSSSKRREPWNILVCSDLGYRSQKARSVAIAEWNDYMASCAIVLSGTAPSSPGGGEKPIYLEHTIAAMKDFSPEALKADGAFAGLSRMLEALTKLLDGKMNPEEARLAIEAAPAATEEKAQALALFNRNGTNTTPPPQSPVKSRAIDAILSMVDTGDAPIVPAPSVPKTASEALFASISGESDALPDKSRIEAYVSAGNKRLSEKISLAQAQPFFSSRKASWQCLRQCASIIGRNRDVRLRVFSAPPEELYDAIGPLLTESVNNAEIPDIIVWDAELTFTNAGIERALSLARAADACKCMVIAPLSMDDSLFTDIENKDTLSPLLQQPRFIPLKKLRADAAARCLCLCGPDAILLNNGDSTHYQTTARGCWPIIIRWLELLVSGANPFAIETGSAPAESILDAAAAFDRNIPAPIRLEAATLAGISLLSGSPSSATLDNTVTAIDPSAAGDSYVSFPFNLLINRVARLSTFKLLEYGTAKSKESLPMELGQFIFEELKTYQICTSPNQVSIEIKNSTEAAITLNSDVLVGNVPARFSFSLDY